LENFLNSADMCPLEEHVVEDELHRLKSDYKEIVCNAIGEIFDAMVEGKVPMTHSGYLKLCQTEKPHLRWPTILLDEAQDTNQVTLSLILDQLQYGTKIILCGDPYQQIYSWRGAIDALAKVECQTLRLTKSFRFGNNIAAVANNLLSKLFGETSPIVGSEQPDEASAKSCTISRTNADMFIHAADGKPYAVVGEARFRQLIDDLNDLYNLSRGGRPRNRAFSRFKSLQDLYENAIETLDIETQMKVNVVKNFGAELPRMIERAENNMICFAETDRILTTAHQSKGLEWYDVTLSGDFPSLQDTKGSTKKVVPRADHNSEVVIAKEECNLLYVACTRAKKKLNPGSSIERLCSR
jgi:superfamily I DNA/RNA helicase